MILFSYTTSYGSLAYFVVEFLHPGHQRFYDCHQGSKAPPPIAASLSKMDATGSRGRRRHAPEVAGPFPMPIRGTSGDAQNGSGCPVGCGGDTSSSNWSADIETIKFILWEGHLVLNSILKHNAHILIITYDIIKLKKRVCSDSAQRLVIMCILHQEVQREVLLGFTT